MVFARRIARVEPVFAALALAAFVLAIDLAWELSVGATGTIAYAAVDLPAHLAVCALGLVALMAASASWAASRRFLLAALIASVAIDLDHLPLYFGDHLLTGTLPRPYTHSAVLWIVALAAIGLVWRRREMSLLLLGIGFGIATHLFRDLATGPGVPLAWPLSERIVSIPYAVFAVAIAAVPLGLVAARLSLSVPARVGVFAAVLTVASLALAVAAHPAMAQQRVGLGAYVSGSEEEPVLLDRYGSEVGQAPLIAGSYRDWTAPLVEPAWLDAVWNRGAIPMITWEPRSWDDPSRRFPLQAIAEGAYDGYLRESARAAAAWGNPIFVRFAHEMNGSWYPWGAGVEGNTPSAYVAAWRRVVAIFREEGAANVRWVWTPYVEVGHRFPFRRYFPGSAWVAWIGLDGLNGGGVFGWRSFAKIFSKSYRDLVGLSRRPAMLAEVGSGEEGGSKSSWLWNGLRRAMPRFPHIRALVWWSVDDPRGDFRVDSSPAALESLRTATASPRYRSSRSRLLALSWHHARHRGKGE